MMFQGTKTIFPRKLIIIGLAIFFADASHSTVIPIFPGFSQSIGASLTILGSYGSVSALAMLILSLPLGRLSDKFGRKLLMIPGLILLILVPLSYLFASNPIHLYPIRLLLGLGTGLVFSNGFLLMTELSSLEVRNLAQGVYMTSMGVGFTLGPLIGGYTAKLFGLNVSFVISAALGLCSLLLLLLVDEQKQTTNREKPMETITLSTILKDPQILAAGMANYLNSLMFNALTLFFPVYGFDVGFDESQVGTGLMTRGLASTAVRLPTGALSKRIKALYLMVFGLTLSAITIFCVSLSTGLILVSVLLGIQGIGYGVYLTSGNVYVASKSDENYRGTAMAIYSIFGNLSGIINPIILGFIAEAFGSQGALKFSSIITLITVTLVFILAKRETN